MDKVFSWRLGVFLSLTLLLLFPGDSQRFEMPSKNVEAVEGQAVLLEAWYTRTSLIEKNTVIWYFMASDFKQIISYSSGEIGFGSSELRKRVSFSASMPSTDLSIYINNTQESDSGRYLWNVIIPGAPGLSGELQLNVQDTPALPTADYLVQVRAVNQQLEDTILDERGMEEDLGICYLLPSDCLSTPEPVPPSTPVCSISGNPVVRRDVTLKCKSSHAKPAPQYKWSRTAPVSEIYFPTMLNEKLGTLSLNNLTESMSGKYVCKASNTVGSDSCYINFKVSTPTNVWLIAGGTVGLIVGFVALSLFLVFIFRRKCDTEEEMSNEIKEDAQAPKRVSWAKSAISSDIISKTITLSSIANSPAPQDMKNNHYPYSPCGHDSIVTASGGTHLYAGEPNPLHGLPGYKIPTHMHHQAKNSCTPRTDGAQPQTPSSTPVLVRSVPLCDALPVMVAAQK